MAIPKKRQIGTCAVWLGVLIFSVLGLCLIASGVEPEDETRTAAGGTNVVEPTGTQKEAVEMADGNHSNGESKGSYTNGVVAQPVEIVTLTRGDTAHNGNPSPSAL